MLKNNNNNQYIRAFSQAETQQAQTLLEQLVLAKQGAKIEEADWSSLYCDVIGAPRQKLSNLPFRDFNHDGVGVEFKFMSRKSPISDVGKSIMHPSATRTISFDENDTAENAKNMVLSQWAKQIEGFAERVSAGSSDGSYDLRWGILLWAADHSEFLYFEERIEEPDPSQYEGRWVLSSSRGQTSRNLHIFEKASGEKKFSCTLPRNGAKLQPYFRVPTLAEGAIHFKVAPTDLVPIYVSKPMSERLVQLFPNLNSNDAIDFLINSM